MEAGAAPRCLRGGGPQIFAQAEAALDTEQATPVGADVRASRTIRMLGEEYEAALDALVAPDREPTSVADLLPQPKRRRRTA